MLWATTGIDPGMGRTSDLTHKEKIPRVQQREI